MRSFKCVCGASGNVIGTGFDSWTKAWLAYLWLFAYVAVPFKDNKSASRESANEKKHRAANDDSTLAASLQTIAMINYKKTYAAMVRRDAAADECIDWAAVWRELAALETTDAAAI